jgi:hypothetical protein
VTWAEGRLRRVALLALFGIGVGVIWWPARPPMVDLAQHAGQVALLRDIVLGTSPWGREIGLNFLTPYLLGFVLALPLSLVMPVAAALKSVLTLAYAAFALTCMGVRRELKAPPQLDAYYLVSFFGFAYGEGLYPFLVAAPVAIAFVWQAIRYARRGGAAQGLGLTALGLLLLFAHGFVFVFAWAIGAGILLTNRKGLRKALPGLWPLVVPLVVCGALILAARHGGHASTPHFLNSVDMGPLDVRLFSFICDSFDLPRIWPIPCFVALGFLPWMAGLKVDSGRRESLVIAFGVVGVLTLAPSIIWSASFIYSRFALFLVPAYAWLFSEPHPLARGDGAALKAKGLSLAAAAVVAFALGRHLVQAVEFSRETPDFDWVMEHAQPGQTALGLVIDPTSAAPVSPHVYESFPLWYQADRQGLVDHSFAADIQEIARFKGAPPPLYADPVFFSDPARFDWRRDDGDRYRYVFVRGPKPLAATLFAGAPRPPALIAERGAWRLFERRACSGDKP